MSLHRHDIEHQLADAFAAIDTPSKPAQKDIDSDARDVPQIVVLEKAFNKVLQEISDLENEYNQTKEAEDNEHRAIRNRYKSNLEKLEKNIIKTTALRDKIVAMTPR